MNEVGEVFNKLMSGMISVDKGSYSSTWHYQVW